MNNLQAVPSAGDLPEGFTQGAPSSGAPAGGGDTSAGSQAQQQRQMAMEEQKQAILEQALTPDALARLRRIKLVKAATAIEVENVIASMAMAGSLPGRINEGKLIEMLERKSQSQTSNPSNGSISIQRKKYAMDSDDEDDNDDDLM